MDTLRSEGRRWLKLRGLLMGTRSGTLVECQLGTLTWGSPRMERLQMGRRTKKRQDHRRWQQLRRWVPILLQDPSSQEKVVVVLARRIPSRKYHRLGVGSVEASWFLRRL